jgi:predicted GNAT family N-acyltransferase
MSNFTLQVASWDVLKTPAQLVRTAVFIREQNIPAELEMDDMDALCVHGVAFDQQGQAVATGRLLPDAHIGRMAVLKEFRGQGLGEQVLAALCTAAKQRGQLIVRLNAQISAENFYTQLGFEREGEEFIEAGIVHISMLKHL